VKPVTEGTIEWFDESIHL